MFKKFSYLLDYFRYLDNPIHALKFKFGLINHCKLRLKKQKCEIDLNNKTALNHLMFCIEYLDKTKIDEFTTYIKDIDKDSKICTINNIKFINIHNSDFKKNNPFGYNNDLQEYFYGDEWNMVNFKNRDVIDIGGNIGDTPLFFAKSGAQVICFEPVKHLYDLGIENINLNTNLKTQITFINKAVGAKKGEMNLSSDSIKAYIDKDTNIIQVTTIPDIITQYDFTPDILKIDCEGCEFEIIEKEDLTMFNDIIFEHHAKITGKDYNNLIKKLETDGFKCDIYPIKRFKFEDIGIIHAHK